MAEESPKEKAVMPIGTVEEEKESTEQPTWFPPAPPSLLAFWESFYPLKVYNSLTRSKVRFVPMAGRRVLWYSCGPTVYAASHMGHARSYLSFDILRRIMTDYFHFDVYQVMNITDIDDKIIARSAERGISFTDLAREEEAEYLADMDSLGVLRPHVLTRVSEFIPEVIEFVERIIGRGFAYASNGSVYFDTNAFAAVHPYAKLLPEAIGNAKALEEGEGKLSAGSTDKRDAADFALWKASKAGEPSWESPWGPGRPGWHIECSAMAGETLKDLAGGAIDIHTGGVDLKFPHHDNEIAQSEAYFGIKQWINYFLHAGHLNIKGRKMSKSEKNFITIKQSLEKDTPRQLRLLFLLHKWDKGMDYGDATMGEVLDVEKVFVNFFRNVNARLRELALSDPQKFGVAEKTLEAAQRTAEAAVHAALSDNFNTPQVIVELQKLIRAANVYMAGDRLVRLALVNVAEFITRILRVFGLVDPLPRLGFSATGGAAAGGGAGGVSREDCLAPVLDAFSSFRDSVREAARSREPEALDKVVQLEATLAPMLDAFASFRDTVREASMGGDSGALLTACDEVRDRTLPLLGVQLEDREGKSSLWKLGDADELRREAEAKEAEAKRRAEEKAAALAAKAERAAAKAALAAEKERLAATPPADYFRVQSDKFSAFDDEGIPTHDAAGEKLGKKKVKKLKKELARHTAAWEAREEVE